MRPIHQFKWKNAQDLPISKETSSEKTNNWFYQKISFPYSTNWNGEMHKTDPHHLCRPEENPTKFSGAMKIDILLHLNKKFEIMQKFILEGPQKLRPPLNKNPNVILCKT